eukprot:g29366.t1
MSDQASRNNSSSSKPQDVYVNGQYMGMSMKPDSPKKANSLNSETSDELMYAATDGCSETTADILDPNVKDDVGETPLFKAAEGGHLEVVELLVGCKASVHCANQQGLTALHAASEGGHLEEPWTSRSCLGGLVQVIKKLLSAKAKIEAVDRNGRTAIFHAASNGHAATVKHLSLGGDEHEGSGEGTRWVPTWTRGPTSRPPEIRGCLPVTMAAQNGHLEVVLCLLNGESEHTVRTVLRVAALQGHGHIVRQLVKMKLKAIPGSALHAATFNGHVEVVKDLLEASVDVNEEDEALRICGEEAEKTGALALYLSAEYGQAEVLKTLLKAGEKWTALHAACSKGKLEVVKALQAARANLDLQTQDLTSALHLAVGGGHLEVVRFLAENQADLAVHDQRKNTPLHLAAKQNFAAACGCLAWARAALDAPNDEGKAPMLLAVERGFLETSRVLLEAQGEPQQLPLAMALMASTGSTKELESLIWIGMDHDKTKDPRSSPRRKKTKKAHGRTTGGRPPRARADVNQAESNGWSPLHVSVQRGHLPGIRCLLEAQGDPNKADRSLGRERGPEEEPPRVEGTRTSTEFGGGVKHRCPIYFAAVSGNLRVLRLLVSSRASPDVKDRRGWSPLHTAVQHGHVEVARCLIDSMADLNLTTKPGSTPLAFAAVHNHFDALELLLQNHADPNFAVGEGFTPLHHAAEFGLEKVLQRLLMARADVERRTREGLTATFIAAQELQPQPSAPAKAEVAKTQMPEGCTPLYAAAACNHLDVVKYLLAAGAEKDTAKEARSTASPLYIAAYKGHTAIVKSLLAARASLAPRSASTEGSTTLSPLLAAVEMAHLDTLQVLLDAKANLAKEGMTALMAAIRHDNGQVVQKLLQAGVPKDWRIENGRQIRNDLEAQLELAGGNGATPLYVAAKNGHKEVLSALLEVRADPQKVRKDGWTPLQVACSQGHVEVVQQLLQAGVDKNKAKETWHGLNFCLDKASERRGAPLHVAAANCHVKVINCLLEARAKAVTFLLNALADQERCQEDGLRPLQIAAAGASRRVRSERRGHVETSRILLGFQQYPSEELEERNVAAERAAAEREQAATAHAVRAVSGQQWESASSMVSAAMGEYSAALHSQAAQLDDESLQVIGEMSFNEQFPAMEELTGHPAGGTSDPDALFQELGFQGYLQQRVHRKLHGIAGRFTPEELLALGKLTFSEQFRSLGLPGFDEKPQFSPGAAARAPVSAASLRRPTRQERPSLFGELGREGFLQQRVHRMLHPRTSKLSDQELLELGRKSFKEQFTALGVAGPKELAEPTLFGELGRSGFLQRRVHRRLHDAANELSDEEGR